MKESIPFRVIKIFTNIAKKTDRIPLINRICKVICLIMLSLFLAIYYTGIKLSRNVGLSTLFIIFTVLLSLSTTSFIQIVETNLNGEIDISTRLELESKETEIDNRTAYDQNLKAETKLDESIELSETEINILRSIISQELEANNRKNFLPTIINNLFFCLLGMIGPSLSKSWRLAYKRIVKF